MGIISIAELEAITNSTIDEEDYPYYQSYIDVMTDYIEVYTGYTFEAVEDEEFVCRADSYGIIEFTELTSVTSVTELDRYSSTYFSTSWRFDGLNSIYGLCPYATYKVVVSYGGACAPKALKDLAAQVVAAGTGLDVSASGGITEYRVGDVDEKFGIAIGPDGQAVVSITSFQQKVLERFNGIDTGTLRP